MLFIKSGKGSDQSDEEIISSFRKSQDSMYIGFLFNRYHHLVFAVSMKYLKNEDDSKDTVIRIFEKLPKDLLTYTIHNFSSWLHTVTKNDCLRFLSKKKNHLFSVENIPDKNDEEDDPFIQQFLPFLEIAIRELSDDQRKCIELFYIESKSYQEISDNHGYSMMQVKSHIQNGKRNLKIYLLKKVNDNR